MSNHRDEVARQAVADVLAESRRLDGLPAVTLEEQADLDLLEIARKARRR